MAMEDKVPEVWFRNPRNYIREVVEVGALKSIWDFGLLRKGSIDPYKFCSLYYGQSVPWESLVVHSDRVIHIDQEHTQGNPIAVYPRWRYGEDSMDKLESMIEKPVGTRKAYTEGQKIPEAWRPIEGQDNRIFLTDLPPVNEDMGRAAIRLLDEIQLDHPEVTFHVHGLYSFRAMFGLNFGSVDCDPRTSAQKGRVFLPTGKEIYNESAFEQPHWVHLLGMRPVDLRVPRNRCMFNIRAQMWAAENFKAAHKIETRQKVNATNPYDPFARAPMGKSIMVRRIRPSEGDKLLCNVCSLQTSCKYFREGAVCIVPGSEAVELAKFFKTRDSDSIIDGLGTLLASQTHRLEKLLETEEVEGKMHPETTKIINTLFDRGVKLAKLVDPSLAAAGAPKVTVNMGDNSTQINQANPQALMAAIVEEFVKKGIPRGDITPEMVMRVFEAPQEVKQRALDVASEEKSA